MAIRTIPSQSYIAMLPHMAFTLTACRIFLLGLPSEGNAAALLPPLAVTVLMGFSRWLGIQ